MSEVLEQLRGENALYDLTYTYHYSKYSCIRWMYFTHIGLCHMVYWVGILCFLTRVVPQIKWTHAFLGRVYVTGMLLATASAMVIHNTGLPLGVLVAFIWVLGGMTLGWFLIKIHQNQMLDDGLALVETWVKEDKMGGRTLRKALDDAKAHIAMAKTWVQRMVSYKAAHGVLMLLSWFNIAGRVWATPFDTDFTCYTYPVYKPRNVSYYFDLTRYYQNTSEPQLVQFANPNGELFWTTMPGGEAGWMAALFFSPVLIGLLIGYFYSKFAASRENKIVLDEGAADGHRSSGSVQLADMNNLAVGG